MQAQIQKKKMEYRNKGDQINFSSQDTADVFTLLVAANEQEEGKFKLDDEELVSSHTSTLHTTSSYKPSTDWQRVYYVIRRTR